MYQSIAQKHINISRCKSENNDIQVNTLNFNINFPIESSLLTCLPM